MLAKPRPLDHIADVEAGVAAEAAGLDALHGHLDPLRIIERSVMDIFHGEVAAVSSFGADSAVLLHMVSEIDRSLPITSSTQASTSRRRSAIATRLPPILA